jgi:hypothetical protein
MLSKQLSNAFSVEYGTAIVGLMAIRSVVESDLSGKTGASTVSFGFGDSWYEVDLTAEERKELEKTLGTYFKVGRKAPRPGQKRRNIPETTNEERNAIREWAQKNGYDIAPRGVIPKKIYAAYQEAHAND